jgi:hypothetical protein
MSSVQATFEAEVRAPLELYQPARVPRQPVGPTLEPSLTVCTPLHADLEPAC